MTATYTFDVFSSLDGFGAASGNWNGYWGKQGPELLEHRLTLYGGADLPAHPARLSNHRRPRRVLVV